MNKNYYHALEGKTILLVNTGTLKKRFIIQKLKKIGLQIVVLNKEKNWAQPYTDHWIIADNTNHSESLQAVQKFMAEHPEVKLDGAITFWEDDVLLTSKITDKFNLTGIPYSISKVIRNKYSFRQFCSKHDIPTPQFYMVRKPEDLNYICRNFEFPVVIKPAFGSSSAFVMKINNKEELYETYRYIENTISPNFESSLTDGLDIFVEEFLDGDEVDIDILMQNGKIKFSCISDNYNKNHGAFFIDSGQAIPSSLPESTQTTLSECAEETIEKLGIQNGIVHFEAKMTKKGPFPIEMNLRMGGDYIYSYIKGAWGVDFIEYGARIAIADYIKIKKPDAPKKYIVGWDLHPNDSGVLVELDVEKELEKKDYLEDIELYKHVGDPILTPPEGFEHLGWITVSGENILDAEDNLEMARKMIDFKVVKFTPTSYVGKTERKNRFSSAVLNKNLVLKYAKLETIKLTTLKNIKKLRLGLLCNLYSEPSNEMEDRISSMSKDIEDALESKGYNVTMLNLNDLPATLSRIQKNSLDLVFNAGASTRLSHSTEYNPHIASLLELFQIPYSGSDAFTHFLTFDKIRFKKILAYHDIPTPKWDYFYDMDDELKEGLQFPLIVKPISADYSVRVSNESVVTNKKALWRRLEYLIKETGCAALVEEYIHGDEYEVYIMGNEEGDFQVLPLARYIYDRLPENEWHINCFERKWQKKRESDAIIKQLPPKNINKKLESLITEIALDTYSIFNCKDYGKVKIKVDQENNPYVIKLKPNPALYQDSGLASASKLIGLDYGDALEEIIYLAVQRYKKQPFESMIQNLPSKGKQSSILKF